MALISLQDVVVAFGGPRIFDELNLNLEPGERVALLGRNGTGKTTLMKVIAGHIDVDGGQVIRRQGLEVRHLPQEVPTGLSGSVFDIVASGLGKRGELLAEYHHVSHRMMTDHSPEVMRAMDRLQEELDRTQSWDVNNQVEAVISQMGLDMDADFTHLSGGQKRRALLARALVVKPDILLLDEPTNHLDIESIDWLEGFLKNFSGTLLFVTHDRVFMRHMATRIIELDRGKTFSAACDYETFLQRKQAMLEMEAASRAEFDKKLAQEEVWIRQGVKARRTRNEGRVKALERMREEKRSQRNLIGRANMQAQEAERSGHLVAKVSNLGYSYGERPLIRNFSANIMRGDRIGIIGPNGSGKTTLIRLLLGKIEPHAGKVRLGTNLEVAYYDQLREEIDEEKTIAENMTQGVGDMITINGKPRHVIGYMQDFLFSPERVRTPVKVLSGGERNRLFLARLFTKPSNVLVMDEPTNDLDIETLELLEELLLEYSGTLLLVSHDRAFLNNVVTSTFVLEGEGVVNEYVGGYDDWLALRQPVLPQTKAKAKAVKPEEIVASGRKLSYKEKKELDELPSKIEKLERELAELTEMMADASFFKQSPEKIAQAKARADTLQKQHAECFERWERLEGVGESDGS